MSRSTSVLVDLPAVELAAGGGASGAAKDDLGVVLDPGDEQLLRALVLKAGLEAEMAAHLGYAKHAAEGRNGENSRNGRRSKTVLTEVGPVDIELPRGRESMGAPATMPERCRRLRGVDSKPVSDPLRTPITAAPTSSA